MANYGLMVITQQGLALYAKAQTGIQLDFTRLQIGSGQLAGQDPELLTALIEPISYFLINSISSTSNTAYVKGIFENTSIVSPTYSCELGLFAQDPDDGEILYAYANAGLQGDTIPAISSGPLSKQFQINAAIGNASNVTASIPADTYIATSQKGAAGGVAPLDSNSMIPSEYVPAVPLTAEAVTLSNPNFPGATNVDEGLDQLFTSASNGKTAIAAAITGMGQAALGSDTFTQLASKIADISDDANALVGEVLATKTFYQGGLKRTGTMPNNGNVNRTPSNVAQSIPAGYTSGGTVAAVVVPAANVLADTTIAGTAGTMPNNGAPTWTPGTANQSLSPGYFSGGTVLGDPDLVAANILNTANIFGVAGTAIPKLTASGTVVASASFTNYINAFGTMSPKYTVIVTGLAFTPSIVILTFNLNTVPRSTIFVNGNNFAYSGSGWVRICSILMSNYDDISQFIVNENTSNGQPLVIDNGFTLPVNNGGSTYNWLAYS